MLSVQRQKTKDNRVSRNDNSSSHPWWSCLKTGVGPRHVAGSIAVLSVFVVVALAWAVWEKSNSAAQTGPQIRLIDNPETVVNEAGRGVVGLWALRGETGETGLIGCGVAVDPRGFILTSSSLIYGIDSLHVIDRANVKYETIVVSVDKKTGLTLLQASPGPDRAFEFLRLGDSETLTEGDEVIALGGRVDPANWELTATPGRVTRGRQSLLVDGIRYRDLIQTDIYLTPENIGGPLVNSLGEIIGFCLPFVRPPGGPPSFSYALPARQARAFLESLPIPQWSEGAGGPVINWLGAEMAPLGAQFIDQLSGPDDGAGGRIVNFVKNNSPADRAGLSHGDVITHVDGNRVYGDAFFDDTAAQWCRAKKIRLTVLRNGQTKQLTVRWTASAHAAPRSGSLADVVLVVLILTLIYYLVYRTVVDRVVLFVFGALAMAVVGQYLGFYDENQITAALLSKLDVLCFLVGMQLVTGILEEAGALEYLGKKITLITGGDKWRILLLFTLVTYGLSLVMNNLTTIILVAPMVLRLSRYLNCDPKPFLISMIIASNLGGASTMIGDFPNMLIGAETGLPFSRFAVYMLPICLLELLVVLVYMRIVRHSEFRPVKNRDTIETRRRNMSASKSSAYRDCEAWLDDVPELADGPGNAGAHTAFLRRLRNSLPATVRNPMAVRRGLIILCGVVFGFLLADFMGWPAAIVALTGGITALVFGGCEPLSLLLKVSIKDIMFFSGLFVLVGAAESSGGLGYVAKMLVNLSFGNLLLLSLLLMWTGAFVTCFLNAGPTTAMFLPIVLSLETAAPHSLYWWALSLGVCAGSSGTLAGATAGSVTATMLDRFMGEEAARPAAPTASRHEPAAVIGKLTFREYSALGMPVMLMLLVMSSIYIALIYKW